MKYYLLFFFSTLGLTSFAQTSLEKAMERIKVSINMPEYLIASQNETVIYVTEITEESPVLTIAQTYNIVEPPFGASAFKAYIGLVNAIIKHKDGEYIIFVHASHGRGNSGYSTTKTDATKIYTPNEIPFSRIKGDFRYGKPFSSVSAQEVYDLDLMLTHCPREKAKSLFNADVMVMYPINLRGNVYEEKYTVCRAIAVDKGGLNFCLYFMMTKDNAHNFEKYLNSLEKVFWFND